MPSEIDAKRLIGHAPASRDLLGEKLRRPLRQAGDDAEAAGIRHRGCQFGKADVVHAALDDGMLDAEQFGNAGFMG